MTITIKPHHLLDVFKLYGRGIYPFSPNTDYQHDFYLVGNLLLDGKVDGIFLTANFDDICKPCRYNNSGVCNDKLSIDSFDNKNDYNRFIDKKLLLQLKLEENRIYKFNELLFLINEKLSLELISGVWRYNGKADNELRLAYTKNGIKNYWNKSSSCEYIALQ